MPDVVVAPPPLYYAQADGTSFKDSAIFGAELEKLTRFRNLITEFVKPSASEPARLEDPSRPWFPMWRVNTSSVASAKGIGVVAPSGLNGSAKDEFGNRAANWDKASEYFDRWFFEPAVTVASDGKVTLGVGAGAVHRAHLVVMSSHGWLGGFAGGEIWEQRKWYLVGKVAEDGRGFKGPVWVILTQCSTLNSATWPSWAKILQNSSPHVRGILGYEEVAPGANTAAAIGKGFVGLLKKGKTFLQAWKEKNPGNNWSAIVHKDAVNDKLSDLPNIVLGKKPLADVSTTATTFNYYGYLKGVKSGAKQEIYLKQPPFGLKLFSEIGGARFEIKPSTLSDMYRARLFADDSGPPRYDVEVSTSDGSNLKSVAIEWIHIRPSKVRLQMDRIFKPATASPAGTVAVSGAKKETTTVALTTPGPRVTVSFVVQTEATIAKVTGDHGDHVLAAHHSYLYPRVTVKPASGADLKFDFPTNGLSWYG